MKERIKLIRLKLKMQQGEFARAVNVLQQQLSKYERGENKPSSEFLTVLVEKFNVNINWLLTGKGEIFSDNSPQEVESENLCTVLPAVNPLNDAVIGTEKILADKNFINNIWCKNENNLRTVIMPDNSMNGAKHPFYAQKNDILLVDISYNEFDFGVYAYTDGNRVYVSGIQPLIGDSFEFVYGNDNFVSKTYTKIETEKMNIKIIGKVLKNISDIIR